MSTQIQLATQCAQTGDFARARDLCQQILRSSPNDPGALHLLGALHSHAGDYHRAIELIERAVAIDVSSAKYFTNLGNALAGAGRFVEAVKAYRRALALDPSLPEVHYNLAITLTQQGKPDEAIEQYRRTIELTPDHAEAYNNLGLLLREQGKLDEAIAACQRAVSASPNSPPLVFNLGRCLRASGRLDEAIECYQRASELDGQRPEIFRELGDALAARERVVEAIEAYRQGARWDPTLVQSLGELAFRLEGENRLTEAERAVETGLALDRQHPLLQLVAAKFDRRQDRLQQGIARLLALDLAQTERDVAAVAQHELGLLYDRIGDSERAFAAFTAANRAQGETLAAEGKDKEKYIRFVEVCRSIYTEEWVTSWKPVVPPDETQTPVFLIGFPRSGTTLLDQILDSHPRLRTVEEKPIVSRLEERAQELPGGFPEVLAEITPEQVGRLRESYFQLASQYVELNLAEVLVDKFPLNIARVPLMWRVFPEARFILALRHPCDVCLSCFMHLFRMNEAMANFGTLLDTVAFYTKMMSLWQQYAHILPLHYHTVRYEDLVNDPEGQVRGLLAFLGLEWNEAVLEFHQHALQRGKINTPSYHQVTEPIYQRAAQRWKRYGAQLEPVIDPLRPFIKAFGYSAE